MEREMIKMKASDFFTAEVYDKYGDIDVFDDYDESIGCAWCGNLLTEEGKEHFKEALTYDITIVQSPFDSDVYEAIVHIGNDKQARKFGELIESAAGYCSEEDYDRWFIDA